MYGKNIHVNEIYQIFRQRLLLYEKASTMPLEKDDQMLLDSKKAGVGMELRMFRLEHSFEERISQVSSRLDELEVHLTTLEKREEQ